jgi:hypothetical protein
MKTTQYQKTAARAIFNAAASAITGAGLSIVAVNILPGDPLRNKPGNLLIAWTAGPVWGELKFEFRRFPMQLIAIGKPQGVWVRVNGTASTPAGFPMLPSLTNALAAIAIAAVDVADIEMPQGAVYVAAAE